MFTIVVLAYFIAKLAHVIPTMKYNIPTLISVLILMIEFMVKGRLQGGSDFRWKKISLITGY